MLKLPSTLPNSTRITAEEFVTLNIPTEKSSCGDNLSNHALPIPLPTPVSTPVHQQQVSPRTPPPTSSGRIHSSPETPVGRHDEHPPSNYSPHPLLRRSDSENHHNAQSSTIRMPAATKHFRFEWLPKDRLAPKDISAAIDPSHIIEGSRRQNKNLPDISFVDEG
jgi:hypothetical protein